MSGNRKRSGRNTEEAEGGSWASGMAAPLIVAGLFTLLAGGIWLGLGASATGHHPEPRANLTGATVMPASRYLQYARVREVYSHAAEIASVLDGLYCHYDCSKHSGHRSLLTCFESDHGAACDICLSEAVIAYRMTKAGRSLDEIREAIDELYGS